MENENIDISPDIDESDFKDADFSVEQKNYSKGSFKRLQKLRADGVAFGINIPVLTHDFNKPEKPRKVFYVFGIISSIFLALGVALSVWALMSALPVILESIGYVDIDASPIISAFTFGIADLFGGFLTSIIWLPVILLCSILIALVAFLIAEVKSYFSLTNCSNEEMAVGYEVKGMIGKSIALIVLSAIVVALFIAGLILGGEISATIVIIFVTALAILAYSICSVVFICKERKKSKQVYQNLPQEQRDNYEAHTQAIKDVKTRIKKIRKVDFNDNWNFY